MDQLRNYQCGRTNIESFDLSIGIKSIFALITTFEVFVFISHFLDLQKKQEKWKKLRYLS